MFKIFSIGPGNQSLEEYLQRLKKWGITCLVDLRSEPYSQYVPQFNRDNLSSHVRGNDIEYLYFGDKLGGRPAEGIEAFRLSLKFSENVTLLLNEIQNKTVAIMCSEFDISKCHRRFIVEEILKRGIEVQVIDKEGNASPYIAQISKKKKEQSAVNSKNQTKLTGF